MCLAARVRHTVDESSLRALRSRKRPRRVGRIVRRGDRVAEGARLEIVCRGNSTVGSNPTLSARGSLCLRLASRV